MKLTYATAKDAQARADKLHADMIATNVLYAESAALYDPEHPEKGGTARWCFPEQALDLQGKVVPDQWLVTVDDRTVCVLSAQEITAVGIVEVPIDITPIQEEIIK